MERGSTTSPTLVSVVRRTSLARGDVDTLFHGAYAQCDLQCKVLANFEADRFRLRGESGSFCFELVGIRQERGASKSP